MVTRQKGQKLSLCKNRSELVRCIFLSVRPWGGARESAFYVRSPGVRRSWALSPLKDVGALGELCERHHLQQTTRLTTGDVNAEERESPPP